MPDEKFFAADIEKRLNDFIGFFAAAVIQNGNDGEKYGFGNYRHIEVSQSPYEKNGSRKRVAQSLRKYEQESRFAASASARYGNYVCNIRCRKGGYIEREVFVYRKNRACRKKICGINR